MLEKLRNFVHLFKKLFNSIKKITDWYSTATCRGHEFHKFIKHFQSSIKFNDIEKESKTQKHKIDNT